MCPQPGKRLSLDEVPGFMPPNDLSARSRHVTQVHSSCDNVLKRIVMLCESRTPTRHDDEQEGREMKAPGDYHLTNLFFDEERDRGDEIKNCPVFPLCLL